MQYTVGLNISINKLSNFYIFRPLLKLVDRLLLVGMLRDEDVGKLLIMINPETWDSNFLKGELSFYLLPAYSHVHIFFISF